MLGGLFSTFTLTGDALAVTGASVMNPTGIPLAGLVGGGLTTGGHFLGAYASSVTSSSTLLSTFGSSLTLGSDAFKAGNLSVLTITGPLLSSTGGSATVSGSLLEMNRPCGVQAHGRSAQCRLGVLQSLLQFMGSAVSLGVTGSLAHADNGGRMDLNGPLAWVNAAGISPWNIGGLVWSPEPGRARRDRHQRLHRAPRRLLGCARRCARSRKQHRALDVLPRGHYGRARDRSRCHRARGGEPANNAICATGCIRYLAIPNLGGYPVLLLNGASPANVTVTPGFVPFVGVGGSNTVNLTGPSSAVITVDRPTSKVRLGP